MCVLDIISTLKYGTSTPKAHTVLLSESTAYIFGCLKYGMETFVGPFCTVELAVANAGVCMLEI